MSVCSLLTLQLTAASAGAQPSCVELSAELPRDVARCVTAQRLCQSYRRALAANGGEREQAEQPEPQVRRWQVQLRAAPDRSPAAADALSLELDALADGRPVGPRTLAVRRSDCAALPDALALVLVLLAQEAAATPVEQPQSTAAVAAAPQTQTQTQEEPPPRPARTAAVSGGGLALGAGAGVALGALPAAAFVLQLQAALVTEPLLYRVRAALLWPQERSVAEGTVLMRDYELAVEACPGLQLAGRLQLALRACVGPRLGLIYARARDFTLQNDRTTEFFLYFGLTPEAALALGADRWLQLSAGAALALVRPRIAVAFGDGQSRALLPALHWLRGELMLSLVQKF